MSSEHAEGVSHPVGRLISGRLISTRGSGSGSTWRHGAPGGRRAALVGALLGAAVLVLAGCAGPTSSPGTPPGPPAGPPPAAASGPATGAPDPNAPEVVAAGDIPDNQVFVPFADPGGAFSVSVPQGWAQSRDGAATVFTDKYNSVRIETASRPTAADVASVRGQDVAQLQGSTPGFVLGDVTEVRRASGPGVLLTYDATSAPSPVTSKSVVEAVERYRFWRGGQEAVLTLSGAKGSDNVDPWRTVTDSLRWQR